jgi:radical SAM superfamily enzyme YgiQ (UPF0313 family)
MKILLILASAPNDPLKKNDPFMPLSLPILAASSPEHDYTFVDMLSDERIDFYLKVDLVGVSYRISAEKTAFSIADNFRKRGVRTVAGGAQASCSPYEAVRHFDCVAVGEGEALWDAIVRDAGTNALKKYYVCSPVKFDGKGESVFQEFEYFDMLKEPLPLRKYYKTRYDFDTVIASRGCPIDCDFCSVSGMYGKKTRFRNIGDVVKEIDSFRNYYYLLDDTVFGRRNSYGYYKELYGKISALKKVRFWTGQANLDAAGDDGGREVIKLAARSGLIYAAVGIESINKEVLEKNGVMNKLGINRSDFLSQMKENIAFIQEQGIVISGWFVVGYDEDNVETFDEILEFCDETNILPMISTLEALPNTRLFDEMQKQNRVSFSKKINLIHPVMNDDQLIAKMIESNARGFSNKIIRRRTMFYMNKFDRFTENKNLRISNKIHKTIFTHILQHKLKKGVMAFANTGDFNL